MQRHNESLQKLQVQSIQREPAFLRASCNTATARSAACTVGVPQQLMAATPAPASSASSRAPAASEQNQLPTQLRAVGRVLTGDRLRHRYRLLT